MTAPRRFSLETVAWLAGLLPLVAGNGAYLISASQDLVPWCVPYIEGCTSVSRAARTGAANTLFKGLMLPYSIVLPVFWWLAARWLGELAPQRRITRFALVACGIVAGLASLLYTAALGIDAEFYQFMRRYGINLNFGFTVLAEMLVTAALFTDPRVPQALRRAMLGLCLAMLVMGLAAVPLQFLAGTRSPALNAIEWIYSVLMVGFFPLIGLAWRRTGFRAPVLS